MIPTCTSYSCLLSLQEKPNGWNTALVLAAGEPDSTLARRASPVMPRLNGGSLMTSTMMRMQQQDCTHMYHLNRTDSPISVFFDDHEDDESDDEDESDHAEGICMQEPLKDNTEALSSTRRCIRFGASVQVHLIPSHRDYSKQRKQRIWTSLEEIRVNAVRSSLQQQYEQYEDFYGEEAATEPTFLSLSASRMTARAG